MDPPEQYDTFYESFLAHSVARQMSVKRIIAALKQRRRVVFVDARAYEEQEVSAIPGAIRISVEKEALQVTVEDIGPPLADQEISSQLSAIRKEDLVVAYCTAGFRGGYCAIALEEKLGRPCYNLTGGMIEWKNQGQEVQKEGELTDAVHPCLPPLEKHFHKS